MDHVLSQRARWMPVVALALIAGVAGCSDDKGRLVAPPIAIAPQPAPTPAPARLYVSNNGAGNAGTVSVYNGQTLAATETVGNNEGIDVDVAGNLYQAGDAGAPPSTIRVYSKVGSRAGGAFDATRDRIIAAPGSTNFKGIAIAHRQGLIFVANFMGNSIEVYGTAAGDMATPVASAVMANNPWDLAYDETNDRLFVAVTNGTVLVQDTFVGGGFSLATARVITPTDGTAASNLHGIAYDAAGDRLVVSDVGSAADATDGSIYVINNASLPTTFGTTTPFRDISGPATNLGNPVDLVLNGSTVRVAEKSNDMVLIYNDILAASGDVAADIAFAQTKPESLATVNQTLTLNPDVTDIDSAATVINSVISTSNPGGGPNTPDVFTYNTGLSASTTSFSSMQISPENITIDQAGDAYIAFDDGTTANSGILVVGRIASAARAAGTMSLTRDRVIMGAATGLISPKGVEVADGAGRLIVADFGTSAADSALRVFGTQVTGNAAPIFTVPLNTVRCWDLDYDPVNDRAYVALTNGTLGVFDNFLANAGMSGGAVDTPDRVITPMAAGTASGNLHGVAYNVLTDDVIVSDVGSGGNPTDGKIYVIENASTASGMTPVAIEIDNGDDASAGMTMLGNPVDIVLAGANLYVAEKSQGMVLRFDNLLQRSTAGALTTTGGDVAPNAMIAQAAPESVTLVPAFLSRAPTAP